MRILHISNNYTPYCGGLVSALNALLPALQNHGHTVQLLTIDFLGDHRDDPEYVVRIASLVKGTYRKNHMAVPWRMRNFVAQYLDGFAPDIVHVHHPFLLGMAGLQVAQVVNIPIVFTYHSQYEAYAHYAPFAQSITQSLIRNRVHAFCNQVNGIIVPSRSIEFMLMHEPLKTPLRVIPSPIQSHFIDRTRQIKTAAGNPIRLLLVSRLVPEKNIEWLLQMASTLLAIKYTFTIAGYGASSEVLKKWAYGELGLKDTVVFVEKPDRQKLINLYQESDLFLFSSLCDTQALVLAEAMSFGTPIIALDGPGQRDIIINGVNGFLVNNAQEMQERITQVAQDNELFSHLSAHALVTAQSYYPEQIAHQLSKYYQEIIKKNQSAPS